MERVKRVGVSSRIRTLCALRGFSAAFTLRSLGGAGRTRRRRRARGAFLVSLLVAALLASSCARMDDASRTENASRTGEQVAPPQQPATANANGQSATGMFAYNKAEGEPVQGNTESYRTVDENPFREVASAPLSTFSIDVDTASYSNTRRFLTQGQLPPKDAVRIEELINYFGYDYAPPQGSAPFSVAAEVADCPWDATHRLVHIGLQGRKVSNENMPPANLVFLVDVSGSMQASNKLPLVKSSLRTLAEQLTGRDRVAMVVYAGTSGLVLPPTPGDNKGEILSAIDRLEAGGSTNGGSGIQLAYGVAQQGFIRGGTNRVILATDGDFNVGVTSESELVRLVEEKRQGGVFLSVLGYGMGNLKDSLMEQLADKGNGNYAYIDSPAEARKVLGEQLGGTLMTIAKDVKIQVEFNPQLVAGYRLVGYENRLLADKDFNDDTKDAGEIGAGHTVTALYEIVPAGQKVGGAGVDELKYQRPAQAEGPAVGEGELMTVKLRYKEPEGDESKLLNVGVPDSSAGHQNASENFKFASAVAEFGMLLRDSKHRGGATYDSVLRLARSSVGADPRGYRTEFVRLVETAKSLAARDGAGR